MNWISDHLIITIIAAIILISGIVVFCVWYGNDHRVYSGEVIGKDFYPAHTTTNMVGIYNGTSTTYIPQTTHHPDKWTVTIRGLDRKGRDGTTEWTVSKSTHEKTEHGSFANFGTEDDTL